GECDTSASHIHLSVFITSFTTFTGDVYYEFLY
ncbi:hypothetical protein A2U01_0105657, partial [Trifolium medium]|nr:hypothetical protein [Trifolium medium]